MDAANADVAPVASARTATTVRIVRAVRIAKRALRGTPTVAVKTPDDLDAAVSLLKEDQA